MRYFLQVINQTEMQQDAAEGLENITEGVRSFWAKPWADKWDVIADWGVQFGLDLIASIAIFIVGRWIVKRMDKWLNRVFSNKGVDYSVNSFFRNMMRVAGYTLIIVTIVAIMGIKTTSLAALIAAIGFAIGMALSGTLQNFAGGVMILMLKPFRTGDYIQAQGQEGTVKEIQLFSTIITTSDNKTIIIPNGGMSTSIVNNFSASGTRRVEWNFAVSFGVNYDDAKKILQDLLRADKRILEKPPYFIAMKSLDSGLVTIVVRAWVKSSDFWDVFYDMNEKVYKLFPLRGLSMPSGKLDVNLSMVDDAPSANPVVNTDDSEHEILHSRNETKDSENSVAAPDDSHEKMKQGRNTPPCPDCGNGGAAVTDSVSAEEEKRDPASSLSDDGEEESGDDGDN